MGSSGVQTAPRETLGQGQAILDFYARQGGGYPMGVGQLSESDAVDALRLPFYSSSHPTGSHGWRNQFDLGNPESDSCTTFSAWRGYTGKNDLPKAKKLCSP